MERTLCCATCGKLMIAITEGKVRKGVTVYCAPCVYKIKPKPTEVPSFFKEIFGGRV